MITCKPKGTVLFSLGLFTLLCYGAIFFLLLDDAYHIERSRHFVPLVSALSVIALALTLRLVFSYRVIQASNGKIMINQALLLRQQKYDLKDLLDAEEISIKTFNGEYKQLRLNFEKGKLRVSKQEYDDYERLKSYIRQRCTNKKIHTHHG